MRQEDEVSDLEWLLLEVERMPGCAATKGRFVALLRSMAGRRLYLARRIIVRPDQVRSALALLDAGATVAMVRDSLLEQGACQSRSVAYVLIDQALRLRGKRLAEQRGRAQADFFPLAGANGMVDDHDE